MGSMYEANKGNAMKMTNQLNGLSGQQGGEFSYKRNAPIVDIQRKMQKETDQKINLVSDKMELEFLIQDQKEAQDELRKEFDRLTREQKTHIERLDQANGEIQKELEKKENHRENLKQQLNELQGDIGELVDDNKLLEGELRNLGDKTNLKIGDMQKKMEMTVNKLENIKGKNDGELRQLTDTTKEYLDRMNDDFGKRMDILRDKAEEAFMQRQEADREVKELKAAKMRGEQELEIELKRRKDRFYDDSGAQFNTVLRVMKNNLRAVEDDKVIKSRKLEEMTQEAEDLHNQFELELNQKTQQDEELRHEVKNLRMEVADKEREMQSNRAENYGLDAELQKVMGDLQKNKFELGQTKEKGEYRLKEMKHRLQVERGEETGKLHLLNIKNEELQEELAMIEEKVKRQRAINQENLESMKNQLNRNIFQTINQHKESTIRMPVSEHRPTPGSFFLNNNR